MSVYNDIVKGRLVIKSEDELQAERDAQERQPKRPLDDEEIRMVWLNDPCTKDFMSRLGLIYLDSSKSCMELTISHTPESRVYAQNHANRALVVEQLIGLMKNGAGRVFVSNGKGVN